MSDVAAMVDAIKANDILAAGGILARNPEIAVARTENGLSLILLATYYGRHDVAGLLARSNPALDLFEASATGALERVQELVNEQAVQVNAFAVDGFTPLGLASFFGHPEIVRFLLSRGAQVNLPSNNAQRVAPLHSAAAAQHLEIARMLIENGANVNAVQADDFTPLQEAAANGQLELVQLLLDHGANPAARTSQGKTALDFAEEKNHPAIAGLLRQRGEKERPT